jgi:hypothetical protein
MRSLLDADAGTLMARLTASRAVIAQERERLRRADRAIALVEESLRHTPADDAALSRLADVIEMQREVTHMKRYFSDEVWDVARRFYQEWPGEDWVGLFRDLVAAIPDGPESAQAEALLHRWNSLGQALWRDFTSDMQSSRQLHEGFARAWRDRANWPATIQRRFADYRMDDVAAFLGLVSVAIFKRRGPLALAQTREDAPHVA